MRLWVISRQEEINLKTTNMLSMAGCKCGKHLDPGWRTCCWMKSHVAAMEVCRSDSPFKKPLAGQLQGVQVVDSPQAWAVNGSIWAEAKPFQKVLANNWAQRGTGAQAPLPNLGLLYGPYFHALPGWLWVSRSLTVVLGSFLPNPSSFSLCFQGIRRGPWSTIISDYYWSFSSVSFRSVTSSKYWTQREHPGISYLWDLHNMK